MVFIWNVTCQKLRFQICKTCNSLFIWFFNKLQTIWPIYKLMVRSFNYLVSTIKIHRCKITITNYRTPCCPSLTRYLCIYLSYQSKVVALDTRAFNPHDSLLTLHVAIELTDTHVRELINQVF